MASAPPLEDIPLAKACAIDATAGGPVTATAVHDHFHDDRNEHDETDLVEGRDAWIAAMGPSIPPGLAQLFVDAARAAPVRHWIVDNSGSMQIGDGKRLVATRTGREAEVACSRWEELRDAIGFHAEMGARLGARTRFTLLNRPAKAFGGSSGPRPPQSLEVGVARSLDAIAADIAAVKQVMDSEPCGMTPLCAAVRDATRAIAAEAPRLRARGERAVLIIASDGAASDGDLAAAMRPLVALPVWVVVRLCTDDRAVVDYWNGVDGELELDLEVLDDHAGEAAEVAKHNPWLAYGAPLHRLREFGVAGLKLLDALDERTLSRSEAAELSALVLGGGPLPLPLGGGAPSENAAEWNAFAADLAARLAGVAATWDPRAKRTAPWLNENALRRAYGGGGGGVMGLVISTAGRDGLRVTPTVAVVFGVVLAVGVFHCCAVS